MLNNVNYARAIMATQLSLGQLCFSPGESRNPPPLTPPLVVDAVRAQPGFEGSVR
jgi:hypothetical protein